MKPGLKGFPRWMKAFQYSYQGFRAAFKSEAAFREEVLLAVIALPLAFILGESPVEKILLSSSVLLLMIVELLNSGIEAVVDRISDEHHELSGRAKDMGSAAVLLAIGILLITWLSILWPRFFS